MPATKLPLGVSENAEVLSAERASSAQLLRCPHCGDIISLKAGRQRATHFAHTTTPRCAPKLWGHLTQVSHSLLSKNLPAGVKLLAEGAAVLQVAPVHKVVLQFSRPAEGSLEQQQAWVGAYGLAKKPDGLAVAIEAARQRIVVPAATARGVARPLLAPAVAAPVAPARQAPAARSAVPAAAPQPVRAPATTSSAPTLATRVAAPPPVATAPTTDRWLAAAGQTLARPQSLHKHTEGNFIKHHLHFENLPLWIALPVPAASALPENPLVWQMALAAIVCLKTPGDGYWTPDYMAKKLVERKLAPAGMDAELTAAVREFYERMVEVGYCARIRNRDAFTRTAKVHTHDDWYRPL